jgi:transmembrane sensor
MSADHSRLSEGLETPAGIAARWLLREHAGELTARETQERDAWLQDNPRHLAVYEQARAVWRMSGQVSAEAEVRAMRAAALLARPERRRWFRPALAAGCALLALAAGGWWGLNSGHRAAPQPRTHYATAVGERLAANLPDGSTVSLNTDSGIEVEFTPGERLIRLRRGQALFEVTADGARPFVVLAGDRRITALGTAFDVRVDNGAVRVLLVEGRVAVSSFAGAPQLALELTAGEQLLAAPDAADTVKSADVDRLTSWRSGRLVFQDDSLAEAVAELNRYTRTPMVIDDPRVAALRVSAVFRISHADRFANSMTELFPLVALKQSDGAVHLQFSTARGED